MQRKFNILRIVAIIWKVIAWIILVSSILGGCGLIAVGFLSGSMAREVNQVLGQSLAGGLAGAMVGIGGILLGMLYFIFLYSFAELIDVLLALEENTRATAEYLKNTPKG